MLVRHVAAHAPRLAALATTAELPADALSAAGLGLARGTAVGVSWNAVGSPLFVYVRLLAGHDAAAERPPAVLDSAHYTALGYWC
eukprot:943126-Prymnesium_polylepis.1